MSETSGDDQAALRTDIMALYASSSDDQKSLSQSSLDTYTGRMMTMIDLMKFRSPMQILKNPVAVLKKLKSIYGVDSSTMGNLVTAVLAVFRRNERLRCGLGEAFDTWRKAHKALKDNEKDRYKQNEPTAAQAKNYVSFAEIEQKLKDLEQDPKTFTDAKQHMQFLLLHVLNGLTPKRADLGYVRILTESDLMELNGPDEVLDRVQKANYILLRPGSQPRLIMNAFKTSKTYSRIEEDLPPRLTKALLVSLKLFPRNFLFISPKTWKPYIKSNSYAQFVRRTFQELFDGRSAGVTMARHAYINERIDFNKLSIAEREAIAKQMGHSIGMQSIYKWKNIDGLLTRRHKKKKIRRVS